MKTEETIARTTVDVSKWTRPMRRDQRFVLLGSCFAQYMGERFQQEGMNALCNPLGAAYNPQSISIQVRESLHVSSDPRPIESSVFLFDGKWRSWWANTLINDTDETRLRERINQTFTRLGKALRSADYLILTLGTNVCYRLKSSGMTVANCHKVPAREFEECALDLPTCQIILTDLVELLEGECPGLQVVFTVSPYRYKKYGLHGSQLAKATLLLAVDSVCKRFPGKASYFPAYEIMLDELRDYRFYQDDMIHPAPEAIEHIWNRFKVNIDELHTS